MIFFNYRTMPPIIISMTVFRDEESDDFEDFGDANISAWLISLHGDIPVTATVYEEQSPYTFHVS